MLRTCFRKWGYDPLDAIEVHGLRKVYRFHQKDAGLTGSFRSLFRRQYKENAAVDDITLTVKSGEFVGFLGPNGAGKTTTLKLLSGLLHPTAGEARVLGFVPWERHNRFKQQFALVMGQKNQLWWDLPALESFLLNREIYLIPKEVFTRRLNELAELLDVADKLKVQVRKLSLGERMKMELIASLLHAPKVIFLDEPTIGLDVVSQKRIRDFLYQYNRQEGTTVLLTSHYMADIQALCERVIIINHGKKIYDGALASIVQQFSAEKALSVRLNRQVNRTELPAQPYLTEINAERVTYRVPRPELMEVIGTLIATGLVEDLNVQEIETDEIVRQIFQGSTPPPTQGIDAEAAIENELAVAPGAEMTAS